MPHVSAWKERSLQHLDLPDVGSLFVHSEHEDAPAASHGLDAGLTQRHGHDVLHSLDTPQCFAILDRQRMSRPAENTWKPERSPMALSRMTDATPTPTPSIESDVRSWCSRSAPQQNATRSVYLIAGVPRAR